MMSRTIAAAAATLAVSAILAAGIAHAGGRTVGLDQEVGGSGACQSALPVFDGVIRKRPLALQNEGGASSFVTCAPHQFTESENYSVSISVLNNDTVERVVTCTEVAREPDGAPVYTPKSATLAANGTATLRFNTFDSGLDGFGLQRAFSCNLPPGTGIGTLEVDGDGTVYGAPA